MQEFRTGLVRVSAFVQIGCVLAVYAGLHHGEQGHNCHCLMFDAAFRLMVGLLQPPDGILCHVGSRNSAGMSRATFWACLSSFESFLCHPVSILGPFVGPHHACQEEEKEATTRGGGPRGVHHC